MIMYCLLLLLLLILGKGGKVQVFELRLEVVEVITIDSKVLVEGVLLVLRLMLLGVILLVMWIYALLLVIILLHEVVVKQ